MNLEDLKIEQTEVLLTDNEYKRRQIRLIAALLDIELCLRQKEAKIGDEISRELKEAA